jgi:hypothetical protein
MDASKFGNSFKYTFVFEHSDGVDTTTYVNRSFELDEVLVGFADFLHSSEVGFFNDITFILHDGRNGDTVIKCKHPSVA